MSVRSGQFDIGGFASISVAAHGFDVEIVAVEFVNINITVFGVSRYGFDDELRVF